MDGLFGTAASFTVAAALPMAGAGVGNFFLPGVGGLLGGAIGGAIGGVAAEAVEGDIHGFGDALAPALAGAGTGLAGAGLGGVAAKAMVSRLAKQGTEIAADQKLLALSGSKAVASGLLTAGVNRQVFGSDYYPQPAALPTISIGRGDNG